MGSMYRMGWDGGACCASLALLDDSADDVVPLLEVLLLRVGESAINMSNCEYKVCANPKTDGTTREPARTQSSRTCFSSAVRVE